MLFVFLLPLMLVNKDYQYTNVTDRRTDTGPKQRPRLRITLRGKS